MKNHGHSDAAFRHLRRELQLHRALLLVPPIAFVACAALQSEDTSQPDPVGAVSFEELTVERINVREPDGRLRLVLSNAARAPDPVVDGKVFEGQRLGGNLAGLIFYNDEGDECGGLVSTGKDGKARAGLMFDRYKQNEAVGLYYAEDDGSYSSGVFVSDQPDQPITQTMGRIEEAMAIADEALRSRAVEALTDEGLLGAQRGFFGRDERGTAELSLADPKGNPRLRASVSANGEARLEFLDAAGAVTYVLPPEVPK